MDNSITNNHYSKENPLKIDGSILEGGGQILRISICLSYLLNIPIIISNIRGKRKNPGLQRQHLECTKFITAIYNTTEVTGFSLNSSEITVIPTKLDILQKENEKMKCIVNSAASIGLMIQEILPCALFTNIYDVNSNDDDKKLSITLTGGTLVISSPTIYYLNQVLFPILSKYMNIHASCDIIRNGIYPIGLGEVIFNVERMNKSQHDFIHPITITERGKFIGAEICFCYTNTISSEIKDICDTIFEDAKKIIYKEFLEHGNSKEGNGNGITYNENEIIKEKRVEVGKRFCTFYYQVVMIYENTRIKGDYMLSVKKGNIKPETLIAKCNKATQSTVNNHEVCVDEHTVDHLIIFLSLAKGISKIKVGEISLHTQTAIETIKQFSSKVKINITSEQMEDHISNTIEIEGMGLYDFMK